MSSGTPRDNNLSKGIRMLVRHAQHQMRHLPCWHDLLQPQQGRSGQHQCRLAGRQIGHADLALRHTLCKPGAQRLGAGLLGGPAFGIGPNPGLTAPAVARARSVGVKTRLRKRSPNCSITRSMRRMSHRSTPAAMTLTRVPCQPERCPARPEGRRSRRTDAAGPALPHPQGFP